MQSTKLQNAPQTANSSELDLILTKFQLKNHTSNVDLNSSNENELIKNYHLIKNLKFDFMESLILYMIKKSRFDPRSKVLFEQYDQILSDILIRINDDKKLINYIPKEQDQFRSKDDVHQNDSQFTDDSDLTSTLEKSNGNAKFCIQTDDRQQNESIIPLVQDDLAYSSNETKNEICLSSDDEDSFDVSLIPCDPCDVNDIQFDSIDDNNDDSLNSTSDFQKNFVNSSNESKYIKRDYPFSKNLFSNFYNLFGLKSFRKNQLECINAAMLNENIFILMPTGSGKSICYQLPATLKNGVTIIISPLRSLIQDQVQKLRMINVQAETLCNDIRQSSEKMIYDDLRSEQPTLKLLYVTPEKISQSKRLIKIMENLYDRRLISGFVIDEAHCVSDYGHDFRPDYKRLSLLKEKFSDVPIMALTATATPRVANDIIKQLKMRNPVLFLQSFNRPNLRFEVREKNKNTLNEIISLIDTNFKRKSGIIYCLSRYECEQVAEFLTKNGIRAMPYHAGLTDKSRFQIQEKWIIDKFYVICATIAFGMGIDKPDVRFVIHYSAPKSIEGYYQEAGRAGRDEKVSNCYLYYNYKDIKRLFKLFEEGRGSEAWRTHINNLNSVAYFATNTLECRKMQILRYFGEKFDPEECSKQTASCDNCERGSKFVFKDYTEHAKLIVRSVEDVQKNVNKKFSLQHYYDIYKGSMNAKIKAENHQFLPMHGKQSKSMSPQVTEQLFRKMILEDLLRESVYVLQYDNVVAYLVPTRKGKELLDDKIKFELPVILDESTNGRLSKSSKKSVQNNKKQPVNATSSSQTNLDNFEEYCYQCLLTISNRYACESEQNQTTIIPLSSLRKMSTILPNNKKEFMKIPHVTKSWFEKYGVEFMQTIQNCLKLKKDTEILNQDLTLEENSLFLDSSDDEIRPCSSTSIQVELNETHQNKKQRID